MLKLGALVLLLAVAATQVELYLSLTIIGAGEVDLSACPIVFYGREYTRIQMSYNNSVFYFCSSGANPECILLADSQGDRMSVEIGFEPTNAGSLIHQALPLIQSNSSCRVQVSLQDETNNTHLLVSLYNFETEGGLVVTATSLFNQTGVNIATLISETSSQLFSASKSQVESGLYVDISACRYSGGVLSRGATDVYDAETCASLSCSSAAVLTSVSTCQSSEICQSNTGCVARSLVCSVTGSTVIDFFRRTHSVTNRCAYSLVKPRGDAAFNVLAGFRERRRQDVMFLDHLILWLQDANVTMYLEQGGRVQVNGQLLQLNATAQLFHNVELSKDQTGVTARIPGSNITIYFDGNTAHVAGSPTAVEGLCGNPGDSKQTTTLSAEKSTSYSISGCETEYPHISDQPINCTITTEQCNLMLQAPFTACHEFSDPDPYVTACNNTLCNYPSVDGLRCLFLEAYAKTCELMNVTLEDWKPAASCPNDPWSVCLDQHCSHHEFCGEQNGETSCLCRAIFASEYRKKNSLGDPVVCSHSSASLSLVGCLLLDKGVDYTTLHLIDESCKGHVDSETHMVTFSFDQDNNCGAVITMNDSQVLYQNTITTKSNSSGIILRHDPVAIDFSCYYEKPVIKTVGFKIKDSSVVQHIKSGIWNYTVIMNAYTDADRTQLVKPTTEIQLNQKVWVELKTEGLDENLVAIVIESCWATDQAPINESVSYDLITNGCPNTMDQTVELTNNGVGTSNYFSFNMFEFSGNKEGVYLHCEVKLCIKQEEPCVKTCGVRRRRRCARGPDCKGLISMSWSK